MLFKFTKQCSAPILILIAYASAFPQAWAMDVKCSATTEMPKYCGCKILKSAEIARYEKELCLDQHSREQSKSRHNPWGVPLNPVSSTNERLLVQEHYVINHDADLGVPTWVAYRLTAGDLAHSLKRRGCFRRDVRLLPDEGAACGDYKEAPDVESQYDRGHLVPSADMVRSEAAMVNTFMFSNMAPQHDDFNTINGGIWEHLEKRVRGWAKAKGTVYVIAGSIFDRTGNKKRDPDNEAFRLHTTTGARVAIPTHFFKIVLHAHESEIIDSLAFVLEHVDKTVPTPERDPRLSDSLKSINEIETYTGVTFLPELTQSHPEQAKALKSKVVSSLWPTN